MRLSSDCRTPVRRVILASAIALAAWASAAIPRPAQAQWAVTCVNCSTTWTQLLEYAKEAQALETQLQQYQDAAAPAIRQHDHEHHRGASPGDLGHGAVRHHAGAQALSNAGGVDALLGQLRLKLRSRGSPVRLDAYANQVLASLGNIAGQFYKPGSRPSATTSTRWARPSDCSSRSSGTRPRSCKPSSSTPSPHKARCRRSRLETSWPAPTLHSWRKYRRRWPRLLKCRRQAWPCRPIARRPRTQPWRISPPHNPVPPRPGYRSW